MWKSGWNFLEYVLMIFCFMIFLNMVVMGFSIVLVLKVNCFSSLGLMFFIFFFLSYLLMLVVIEVSFWVFFFDLVMGKRLKLEMNLFSVWNVMCSSSGRLNFVKLFSSKLLGFLSVFFSGLKFNILGCFICVMMLFFMYVLKVVVFFLSVNE